MSSISTLCSGDFTDGVMMNFDNVTLYQPDWRNITITVTCSFEFNSYNWSENIK